MNHPTHQSLEQPTEITFQTRNAWRNGLSSVAGDVAAVVFFLYLALQTGAWQLYTIVGSILALVVVGVIGLGLIRRKRPELGMWLIIGALLPVLAIVSALVTDLGLLMGLAAMLLTSGNAASTLSQKGTSRAIIAAAVMAVVALLLDQFVPPEYRLVLPAWFQTFLPVLVSVLIMAYGLFIARQFANYTLRTKFIVTFLIIALIPLGILTFLNDRSTRADLTDAANQRLVAAASQTAASIDAFIGANLDAVRTEAQLLDFVDYLSLPPNQRTGGELEAKVTAVLLNFSRKDPVHISSYALLDGIGTDIVDTYTLDIGLDKSDRDYFQTPLRTGLPYVSPVEVSQTSGEVVLFFSAPIRNAAGEIIGVLQVRYNATILQQLVVQNTNLPGEQSFAVLFDENHIHLAHGTAPKTILKAVGSLDPALVVELQAAERLPNLPASELSMNLPDLDQKLANVADQPYFTAEDVATGNKVNQVAVAGLKRQPWLVAFFQPQEVFLAPVETQTRNTLLVTLVIAGVVVSAAMGVAQLLAGPITHLTTVAAKVAAGDLTAQAPVGSQDETGQLAVAFNNMTTQIRHLISSLEDQVRERTAELVLSMKVGQRALAIRDLAELLPTITEFIRNRFNLYYTQIYFVDDLGQNLVLRAGTGAVGEELLARRHSLPVGPGSIVGQVVAENRGIVVSNTENGDIHKNPLLPETRSELAVPLVVEGRVIGVLDMQANRANTFTEHNLIVFEAMATQLANAIDSARQWALGQEAQRKAEEAIRQLTRQSWIDRLASHRENLGFTYDLSSVTPLVDFGLPILDFGLKAVTGESASHNRQTGSPKSKIPNRLAVPVVVQNEPIGQLAIEVPPERAMSPDEQNLLAAVAQQLGQKAENLRLFEQTQQRAAREQIARQITDKVRASRDIESALKIAVEELSKALAVSRVAIDLKAVQVDETDQQ